MTGMLRIAWSVGWLIALVLLLPNLDESRGPGSTLVPPSRWIVPMLIGFPLIAAIPWIPWIRWSCRFSLRTLLIAMTLVAVALGLIMWTAR
jgi:hypothetical protein